MSPKWHVEHFVAMAKIAHHRAMRRMRDGNMPMYFQAKVEREYFMKMARGG